MNDTEFGGAIIGVSDTHIYGWAFIKADREIKVILHITMGDQILGEVIANQSIDGVGDSEAGTHRNAFIFHFTTYIVLEKISVRIKESEYRLSYENHNVNYTIEKNTDRENIQGYIDEVTYDNVSGWVWISDDPIRIELTAVSNGQVVGSTIADLWRPDLHSADIGDGRHGFDIYMDTREFLAQRGRFYAKDGRPLEILDLIFAEKMAILLETTAGIDPEQGTPAPGLMAVSSSHDEAPATSDAVNDVDGSLTMRNQPPAGDRSVATPDQKHSMAAAAPGTAVAVGPTAARGVLLGMADGKLTGWAVLEDGLANILVTVDGSIIGEAKAAGVALAPTSKYRGITELQSHGFEIVVPDHFVTDANRRVSIYNAATGRRIPGLSRMINFAVESRPPVVAELRRPPVTPDDAKPGVWTPSASLGDLAAATPVGPPTAARAAVVAWDMAHNPVGRAFLVADMLKSARTVQLVGPTFAFYGGRIWPPISETTLPMRSFHATDLRSLVGGAVELAATVQCDVVVVGKPRLSSLVIGALIRHANNCPMIVDIDDHELSFVKNRARIGIDQLTAELAANSAEADIPYSDTWTRFAETLVPEADGIIVSNIALRRKFGGVIVRHGRDEAVFNPALYDRRVVREAFGYTEADRVVLFLGTPRPHKGIFDLCDALERLGDARLALCVIGSVTDKRILKRFSAYKNIRLTLHPDQPWQKLPELVGMADAVAILQDPSHPIAEFQIPAKLTDALALDVPVIASAVPPLEDLAKWGAFQTVADSAELDAALRSVADSPPRGQRRGSGRAMFLTEFSYGVNAARLDLAIAQATAERRTEWPVFEQLFRLLEARTGIALPTLQPAPPPPARRRRLSGKTPPDMVFLWKQNDSDVYGRRSDMVAKYMLRTGRVRRVIHFDAPISASALEQHAVASAGQTAHQGNLVYVNTVRRILRAADTPNFTRRTFLHRSGSRPEKALGQDLPARDAYPDFVRDVLRDVGVTEPPLLWVCPVVPDYEAVVAAIDPAFVVADVIDDQRTFPGSSETYRRQVAQAYEVILRQADAVFSNCEPVREAFAALRADIKMVPNGAELFPDADRWDLAADLRSLPRPIIGYVGNLRDRVDLDLIGAVAERFPRGTVLLVGSAHGRPEVPKLAERWPNIRLLGVRPYEEAQRIIRGFDVAIMPHLRNEQSERMNPLKLYVYFSVGVPVVTTDVANIGDLAAYVNVAPDRTAFLDAIDAVLAGGGRRVPDAERAAILTGVSWDSRVAEMWRHIENLA